MSSPDNVDGLLGPSVNSNLVLIEIEGAVFYNIPDENLFLTNDNL